MKTFLTLLLLPFCFGCFAQKIISTVKVLKTSTYAPDGTLWPIDPVQMDTVKTSSVKLDIHYFLSRSHSYIIVPDSFVNTRYKSETAEVQYGKPDDKTMNFKTYFTYDSLSRITNYGKTQCMVCDFLGYEYNVHYNSAGQIDEIAGAVHTQSQNRRCKLYYNSNGDIKQLDNYIDGKLSTRVILM